MSDIEWLAKFLKYFLIMSSFALVIIAIMWGYAIWKWSSWKEIRSVKRRMKEGQKIMDNAVMIKNIVMYSINFFLSIYVNLLMATMGLHVTFRSCVMPHADPFASTIIPAPS